LKDLLKKCFNIFFIFLISTTIIYLFITSRALYISFTTNYSPLYELELIEPINKIISFFLGIAISIAYIIITNPNTLSIIKILVGYICIILVFPPLYEFSINYRLLTIKEIYFNSYSIFFYMLYTIIFFLIYLINYKINKKITYKLNENLKKHNL